MIRKGYRRLRNRSAEKRKRRLRPLSDVSRSKQMVFYHNLRKISSLMIRRNLKLDSNQRSLKEYSLRRRSYDPAVK